MKAYNLEVATFIKIFEVLNKFSLKQDKKKYLYSILQENKKLHRLFDLLVSYYFEFYKQANYKDLIKVKANGKDNLLKAFWFLYFDSDNFSLLKSKLQNLDEDIKIVVNNLAFGQLVRELGEDFILSIMNTYFNKARIYELLNKAKGVKRANIIENYVLVDYEFQEGEAVFPFYVFKFKGQPAGLYFVYKKFNNLYSNDKKSKRFHNQLKMKLHQPHFILFYYKVYYKKEVRYVPLMFSENLLVIETFLKDNVFDMSSLSPAGKLIKSLIKQIPIEIPQMRKISQIRYIRENYKFFTSTNVCFCEKGIFSVKLKSKREIFKVTDLMTDKNHNPIGVFYLDENKKLQRFKTYINEEMLSNGIHNYYVEGIKYVWNDVKVRTLPLRLREGLVFICRMCEGVFKEGKQLLCLNCYNKLKDIAKYSNKKEFSVSKEELGVTATKPFFCTIDKYYINYTGHKFTFRRNYNYLKKPAQLLLPFYNPA